MRNNALIFMPTLPFSKFTLLFPTTSSLLLSFFLQTALWEILPFLVSLRPSKHCIQRAMLASGTSRERELGCRLRRVELCTEGPLPEAQVQVRLLRGAYCLGSLGPLLTDVSSKVSARTQRVHT